LSRAPRAPTATRPHTDSAQEATERRGGVLPSQRISEAVARGWISAPNGDLRQEIPSEAVQAASIDLRLSHQAWKLRCSFLPDPGSRVEDRLSDVAVDEINLRDGATFDVDRPYLVRLIERLKLPPNIRGKTNPKSSTGRIDVFTRVITDKHHRFDDIKHEYVGNLYLEVVPRSFTIRVKEGLALNQLRFIEGDDARLNDDALYKLHAKSPLIYGSDGPVPEYKLLTSEGLFLSVDLSEAANRPLGYKVKRNSRPLDLSAEYAYGWRDYWEPVHPDAPGRIILEPETFYLLLSAEGVSIPPECAAEMMAYDPTAGELRTHYAGFFDPGFGYHPEKRPRDHRGSRAALEIRARDVPFMVEHGQPICKLAFEYMTEVPDVLYGKDLGSNYQGQITMLSKHFADQTAGGAQMRLSRVGS
jgi:dCTP deaminase